MSQVNKLEHIAAFFDDAKERANYLFDLRAGGRTIEALTLCLLYIDSFSQKLFWPRSQSGKNFVEALVQHSGDPEFCLVHPLAMARAFAGMNGHWVDFATRLSGIFPGPTYSLHTAADFLQALSTGFTASEAKLIEVELWRGSIANVAYVRLRNPSVHSFRRAAEISFDNTTHQGQPARPITFQRLHDSLLKLVAEAERRSFANNQWFGNDQIVS